MALALFVNGDGVAQVAGSVVRFGALAGTCYLAQADSLANCQDLIGTRLADVAPGASGTVGNLTDGMVAALDGVAVAGDLVYLSAATAGRGTATPPTIKVILGRAYDVQLVSGTYYARLTVPSLQLGEDQLLVPWQRPRSLLKFTQFGTVGSGTHNFDDLARSAWVQVVGGGAAGGGAAGGAGVAVGGGGGGAGSARRLFTLGTVRTLDWVVGAGGTGVSGDAGNPGSNSTATYDGTTVTGAGGASGGGAGVNGTTPLLTDAGAAGVGSGGDENFAGATGGQGMRFSTTAALGGSGGNSLVAMGAGFNNSDADGISGYGPGAGGSGGHALAVTRAGGPGFRGRVYVWEYS